MAERKQTHCAEASCPDAIVQYSQPNMKTYGLDSHPVLLRKRLGETEYEWLRDQLRP